MMDREWLAPETEAFVRNAAQNSLPVLLVGETGTGKSVTAELIHCSGHRKNGPFVPVPCGGLPHDLLERELFGHERGAFTGAVRSAPGLVEAANHGTLLLDDIDVLLPFLQAKILDLVDRRRARRIGSTVFRQLDIRIVATTNRDPIEAIANGDLRRDLYYRLSGLQHRIPSVSERPRQIRALLPAILADIWSREFARTGSSPPELLPEASSILINQRWEGNFREIRAVLSRILTDWDGGPIRPELALRAVADQKTTGQLSANESAVKQRYIAPDDPDEERQRIAEALIATEGNRTLAAQRLGMSRSTLWIRIKIYDLAHLRTSWREEPSE